MKPRHSSSGSGRGTVPARQSRSSVRGGKGTKAEMHMTIQRPREDLFAFWRNFENLPRVMEHVESVECLDEKRSRWRVRTLKDKTVEWESEVINERANEMIAWRTLEGSQVHHAGSIWFTPAPGGLGTEVKLAVEYEGSAFADAIAKLFRRSPEQQMREDLRRFKQWAETGEMATTRGQPAARPDNNFDKYSKYEEAK